MGVNRVVYNRLLEKYISQGKTTSEADRMATAKAKVTDRELPTGKKKPSFLSRVGTKIKEIYGGKKTYLHKEKELTAKILKRKKRKKLYKRVK